MNPERQRSPERRQPNTRGTEASLLERLRNSKFNPFNKKRAEALLGLFMLTTTACESTQPETAPVVEVAPVKPPLPPELLKEAEIFQDKLLNIDDYENPIDINGVTTEINVAGQISLAELDHMVVDLRQVSDILQDQGIYLLDQDINPTDYLYNTKDHPKPEPTSIYTVPGYQLSATYGSGVDHLQLRNWVAGTTVLDTEVPQDLVGQTAHDLALLNSASLEDLLMKDEAYPQLERTATTVKYSLGEDKINTFKAAVESPLDTTSARADNDFMKTLARVREQSPNAPIVLEGYSTSITFEDGVSLDRVRQLNDTIHIIEAVFAKTTGSQHGYRDQVNPASAITDTDGSIRGPRHHIQYTVDTSGSSLHLTITDNVTGTTITQMETYSKLGEVTFSEEDATEQLADELVEDETAPIDPAVEAEIQATTNQDASVMQTTRANLRSDLNTRLQTFTDPIIKALRDDKIGMYQTYEALRTGERYRIFEHDINVLQVVEGNGMEKLRYLMGDKRFTFDYSVLPVDGFDKKSADTKQQFEGYRDMTEYGGTFFVEGHLTNLTLNRNVFKAMPDYDHMKPTVSMEKDQYGNVIFREVTYHADAGYYRESFNVMLRLPANTDTAAGAMATVSLDLSAYGLGDYPELLKHLPDKAELVLNDQNADYQVYSRVKGLELGNYTDKLQQIGAGAAQAEQLFGFDPGELMHNIIIIDANDVNAHYAYDKPTTIVINDEYLKKQPAADQWNVGFHETVHLLAQKYQLDEVPELVTLYGDLQDTHSRMLEDVNEKTWYDEITIGGHAQDNLGELLPSLIRSTLDPNLEASLRKLSRTSRADYIKTCEALATTMEAIYETYDTGKAKPTVHLKLREAAAIAKRVN